MPPRVEATTDAHQATFPHARTRIPVVLAVFLIAAFFAARSGTASGMSRQLVLRTTINKALHEKVLVNRRGFTLYSLSAERHGRFICTDKACLSLWAPLVVPKGTVPTGVPRLGTVRRPDGRTQVAYRGLPVYRFNGDRKPGDVKGNGFRDVGVWRPASPGPTGSSSPPSNPYPGYPGYGG